MPRSRKRGAGEGSIWRRSDGRWCGAISVGPSGDRKARKYVYGTTRREVATKLKLLLADQERGLPVTINERTPLGTYLDEWLETTAKPRVRAATLASYRELVRLHVKPELGRVPLARLEPAHLQRLYAAKLEEGKSPARVRRIHAVLRVALRDAARSGAVGRNVMTVVDAPRVPKFEPQPLTTDEVRRFLGAVQGERWGNLFTVAMEGLRRGEICGLRWSDVDLRAGTLTVRHALQRVNGRLELVEPKSKTSRRTIKLAGNSVRALRRQRQRQREERLRAGRRWMGPEPGAPTCHVFTTRIGGVVDGSYVSKRFREVLERAGIEPRRFHDLRHASGSLLLAAGVDIRTISKRLGHSSAAFTLSVYTHVMPEAEDTAAERLNAVLTGTR